MLMSAFGISYQEYGHGYRQTMDIEKAARVSVSPIV